MNRLIPALLFALMATSAAAAPDERIATRLRSLAALLSDGRAVLYERSIDIADAPMAPAKNSTKAYATLFTIEGWGGGNGASQYLAVFQENDKKGWPEEWNFNALSLIALAKVGKDYQRQFESISVSGDLITLKGHRWKNDPHCCPSQPITAYFKFARDAIVEQPVANKTMKPTR
jgi:hypothetical protein